MAGIKGKSGGARRGSGPKSKQLSAELRKLFDVACPMADRQTIIRAVTARAQAGDALSANFIFNRVYGTPVSGDELKLREQLEAELDDFYKAMEKNLTPQAWLEVRQLFGLEDDGA